MEATLAWKGDYLECNGVVRGEVTRGLVDRLFYFLIDNEWGHLMGFEDKLAAARRCCARRLPRRPNEADDG